MQVQLVDVSLFVNLAKEKSVVLVDLVIGNCNNNWFQNLEDCTQTRFLDMALSESLVMMYKASFVGIK